MLIVRLTTVHSSFLECASTDVARQMQSTRSQSHRLTQRPGTATERPSGTQPWPPQARYCKHFLEARHQHGSTAQKPRDHKRQGARRTLVVYDCGQL